MIGDIARWWAHQMGGLLSGGARPARQEDALVVQANGGLDVTFALRRGGRLRPVGTASLDAPGLQEARALLASRRRPGPAVIGLQPALALEQEVILPLAAEVDLDAVIGHEMDRLTPFRAQDVYRSQRVMRRDRAAGRLLVRLTIIPKLAVQPLLEALRHLGVTPAAFEVAMPGGMRRIGVAAPGRQPGDTTRRLAAAACVALALAAAATPWVVQALALNDADAAIAELRPLVAQADALRSRLASGEEGAAAFAAEAARTGDALRTLAAVTRALPDDTYLTGLTLRDRKLALTGRSSAAVRLIGTLSAEPALRNAAFAAPVMRMAPTGVANERSDEFSIHADLAP